MSALAVCGEGVLSLLIGENMYIHVDATYLENVTFNTAGTFLPVFEYSNALIGSPVNVTFPNHVNHLLLDCFAVP